MSSPEKNNIQEVNPDTIKDIQNARTEALEEGNTDKALALLEKGTKTIIDYKEQEKNKDIQSYEDNIVL